MYDNSSSDVYAMTTEMSPSQALYRALICKPPPSVSKRSCTKTLAKRNSPLSPCGRYVAIVKVDHGFWYYTLYPLIEKSFYIIKWLIRMQPKIEVCKGFLLKRIFARSRVPNLFFSAGAFAIYVVL